MKAKLLVISLFFTFIFCYSQTEKSINGIVLCDDLPVQGVEVVNLVTEKISITDTDGKFSISAKEKDLLVIVSKKHFYKRLSLEKSDLKKNSIEIKLTQKPEELDEVVITKLSIPSAGLFSQEAADEIKLEKGKYRNRQINDGTIENGADLRRIGGMILSLFKKENDTTKKVNPEIKFKNIAKTTYDDVFFIKTLKLKPEEVTLFLDFCDVDPKSKTVAESDNPLSLLDFMLTKNSEFKKLSFSEKKETKKPSE